MNLWSEVFSYLKNHRQQLFLFLFVLFLVLLIEFIGWRYIIQSNGYDIFQHAFSEITGFLSVGFSQILGYHTTYESIGSLFILSTRRIHPIIPIDAFKFYFIAFLCLILVPKKNVSNIVYVLITIVFLIIRATIISTIKLLYFNQVHNILLLLLEPMIFLPMFFIVLYILKNNSMLRILYDKINQGFNHTLSIKFTTMIILVILITPLPRVFLTYMNGGILEFITNQTLILSRLILHAFNYANVNILGKTIYLDNYWIQLENPCLGIGIFTVIAILIFSVKSVWVNKLIFFILLFPALTVVNALRIALLLMYFKHNFGFGYINLRELHDTSSNIIYLVAFGLFILYLYWFQNIDILKFKKKLF